MQTARGCLGVKGNICPQGNAADRCLDKVAHGKGWMGAFVSWEKREREEVPASVTTATILRRPPSYSQATPQVKKHCSHFHNSKYLLSLSQNDKIAGKKSMNYTKNKEQVNEKNANTTPTKKECTYRSCANVFPIWLLETNNVIEINPLQNFKLSNISENMAVSSI